MIWPAFFSGVAGTVASVLIVIFILSCTGDAPTYKLARSLAFGWRMKRRLVAQGHTLDRIELLTFRCAECELYVASSPLEDFSTIANRIGWKTCKERVVDRLVDEVTK
jgi:hypothetical protein